MTFDHVAGYFGGVACRKIGRDAKPSPHAVHIGHVADFDRKASLAKMLNPSTATAAVRVFAHGDCRFGGKSVASARKQSERAQPLQRVTPCNHCGFGGSMPGMSCCIPPIPPIPPRIIAILPQHGHMPDCCGF